MRKLFWFKSSSSNTVDSKVFHSTSADDKVPREDTQKSGLRRSRSLSSTSFHSGGLDESRFFSCDTVAFPHSSSNVPLQSSDYPVCNRSLNPERQQFSEKLGEKIVNRREIIIPNFNSRGSSKLDYDSSENSSCSSQFPRRCESARYDHASNDVLDLYIDGEQKREMKIKARVGSSPQNPSFSGNRSGRRPPRVHSTAPGTPTGSFTDVSGSYSLQQMRDSCLHIVTRESSSTESGLQSPQKLAKNVVKRLSQVSPYKSKVVPRDTDLDSPTTVEDIYEDYMEPHRVSTSGVPESVYPLETEEVVDLDLHRKAKNALDRVVRFSEELESDNIFRDSCHNASSMYQIIRNLLEERRNLALEVSSQFQYRIADRASASEALRVAKTEMDSQTLRLEKEKNELQSRLEKELDRRSSDWSFQFQKYQEEEQRLRERVRELAEQNVSLQREVSFLNGRDGENMNRITHSEQHLKDLKTSLEEVKTENSELQENIIELQEQFRSVESDRDSVHRSYKEKERENKELHKAITRLQRACNEQEKTINGLQQGLSAEVKQQSSGNYDSLVGKLQMEQVRLTGLEQTLRREVESFRLESESLRRENITLLERLRCSGDASGSSCYRLDQELLSRVDCLQNQGMLLVAQSSELSEKLLELLKASAGQNFETATDGQEVNRSGLDSYVLLESDMKLQSFRAGFENLKRGLRMISSILHKKSDSASPPSQPWNTEDSRKHDGLTMEDHIKSELQAEVLLTTALRDKLFTKQLEIDQLQAELATAIRGHDILRCEVQATKDAVSSMSHNMKELELQILRKDETVNQLEKDLQDCSRELNMRKGVLSHVSQERDMLWEEIKKCTEQNMLLGSEVKTLKKKIDFLDEDILVKEGQITILKDSLDNKPFDILSTKSF